VTNSLTWTVQPPGSLPHVVATGSASLTHTFTQTGSHVVKLQVVADTNFVKPPKYGANQDTATWSVSVAPLLPPEEVAPPGAVSPLLFLTAESLDWGDLQGVSSYNLYRGSLASLAAGDYGSCAASGLTESETTDGLSPASGAGWSYLVTGENAAGEGSLGSDSSGAPRPNGQPCAP
jgi:hypothetical protein